MKQNIPQKFSAKVNEFMVHCDIRLAPGLVMGSSFIEGSWCEAWVVFPDKSANIELSDEDERLKEDILAKLVEKGFEYTVRQVNISDKYSPLRCEVGDYFHATADPELIKELERLSRPVTVRKPKARPPEQTQI